MALYNAKRAGRNCTRVLLASLMRSMTEIFEVLYDGRELCTIFAVGLAEGVPMQLVREDKALAYSHRASVMWRIGIALYTKAGGIPWKLAETDPETAYIGISYAVRPNNTNRPRFVTCCSQVFDAEGAGLEFVAYDAHEVQVQRDNPFLSRAEMFRVMSRSMDLYRRRHAGRSPRRVMVHKTTEFKMPEIDGCMEALHLCEGVDLIQIVEDVSWRAAQIQGMDGTKKGQASAFPVARGTLVGIGPYESLLWTHGSTSGIGNREYSKGQEALHVRFAWCATRVMERGMMQRSLFWACQRWTGTTMPYMTLCQ